jgi:hypothetical protein
VQPARQRRVFRDQVQNDPAQRRSGQTGETHRAIPLNGLASL